jgi:hypothetical protein
VVPDERIELPTNGLQNRCSTAELIRPACRIVHNACLRIRAMHLPGGRLSDG